MAKKNLSQREKRIKKERVLKKLKFKKVLAARYKTADAPTAKSIKKIKSRPKKLLIREFRQKITIKKQRIEVFKFTSRWDMVLGKNAQKYHTYSMKLPQNVTDIYLNTRNTDKRSALYCFYYDRFESLRRLNTHVNFSCCNKNPSIRPGLYAKLNGKQIVISFHTFNYETLKQEFINKLSVKVVPIPKKPSTNPTHTLVTRILESNPNTFTTFATRSFSTLGRIFFKK